MAQSHTPHNHCVRFAADVTVGSRNTLIQAVRYTLPGLDFHQPTAPASWRTAHPGYALSFADDQVPKLFAKFESGLYAAVA